MAWIELHQTLRDNRKTMKLKRLLNIKTPQAIGHLCLLWLWAIDNAPEGDLSPFVAEDIAEVCEYPLSKAAELLQALIESGFIDQDMHIHDWNEYIGKLIATREYKREQARIRQQRYREKMKGSNVTPSNACETNNNPLVTHNKCVTNAHNPTQPNRNIITIITPPIPPKGETLTVIEKRFDDFWKAYPKKVGKAAVYKAWKRLSPNQELFDKIMSSLEWQKKSEQWTKSNGQFIPNPLTWINQGRWDNEPMQSAVIDKKTPAKVIADYATGKKKLPAAPLKNESFDVDEFIEAAMKRGIT